MAAPIQLLDLHPDILLKIFREFIPLKDKLHTLFEMPEFRPLLQYRGSYLASSAPFSCDYLEFLRAIRPGWYVSRQYWPHHVYLRIEESTLRVSLLHFLLHDQRSRFEPNARFGTFRLPIHLMVQKIKSYMDRFYAVEDRNMLTYFLKGYGFIMVDHTESPKVRMYEGTEYMIEKNVPLIALDRLRDIYHFKVMWTGDEKLIVECRQNADFLCRCEETRVELSPCRLEMTPDYKMLGWEGGNSFPLVERQDYVLGEDYWIEAYKIYHLNFAFKNSKPLQEPDRITFKRLLWEEDATLKRRNTEN